MTEQEKRFRPSMTLCERLRPGIGLRLGMEPMGAGPTPPPVDQDLYLQPDGVSLYLQPDGTSLYLQPS